MDELSIYKFIDYRKFLSEYFNRKKKEKPYFSHRFFCKEAGFKTPSVIKLVIDGKRNLTRTSLIKVSHAIGFNEHEHAYFETLVLYDKTRDPDEKRDYLFKLAELKGLTSPRIIERSRHGFYQEWYHTVVRECLAIPGLTQFPEALAKKIWPRISPDKIRDSIALLYSLGLTENDKKGAFRQKNRTIATEDELNSEFIANFNRDMIRIALQASLTFPRQQREISGVTLRISRPCFKEIKKRIANFKKELLDVAIKDKDSDQIYQLNFQLFPLLTND
jgi:uncharacterized protein (TIGR02147 family)